MRIRVGTVFKAISLAYPNLAAPAAEQITDEHGTAERQPGMPPSLIGHVENPLHGICSVQNRAFNIVDRGLRASDRFPDLLFDGLQFFCHRQLGHSVPPTSIFNIAVKLT